MHRKSACLVLPAQIALLPVTSESANSVCTGFIRVLRATFTERGPACLPADQPPQMHVCQQGASALATQSFRVSTNIWSNCNPCKRYLRSPAVAGVVVVVVVEEEDLRT